MIVKTDNRFVKDALFISYTGIKDYLKCPRSYFLKNVYRDPKTKYKIQVVSSHMTLGALVHDAIGWYLQMQGQVTKDQLIQKFRNFWLKYRGKRGGFATREEEGSFGKRGLAMLDNFFANANVLEPKVNADDFLKFKIDDTTFLNGRVDFLGQMPDGSIHVLDFKTGSKDEEDPLQLYIYAILVESNIQKPVSKISYWYLDRDSNPKEAVLDSLNEKLVWLKNKCQEIKEAIKKDSWVCVKNPDLCRDCQMYQAVLDGKAEFQYQDDNFKKMVYYLYQ